MKILSTIAILAAAAAATSVAAQSSSSSTTKTYQTPVGPLTHTQTTVPLGNGTHTTHTVSPGNGSKPSVYLGATVSDPAPNRQQSTKAPTAGVTIPY